MNSTIKSWVLLVIFGFSLVPFGSGQAWESDRTLAEARSLLYLGRAFLEEEANLDTAVNFPGLLAPTPGVKGSDGAEDLMGRMIHATKQERNQLQSSCRELKAAYQAKGRTCELQVLNDYCQSEENKLNRRIGFLHKLRGDRRKLFTRFWHGLKRTGGNIWHAVGPVGRRILRRVGPKVADIVLSGGGLSGGVLRRILIHEAREVGRAELNRLLNRGLERFLLGQANLARAAGAVDCSQEELAAARQRMQEGEEDAPVPEEVQDEPQPALNSDEFGSDEDFCQPGDPWLTAAWEETVVSRLKEDGKHCFSSREYYSCLQDQETAGVCPLDAFAACEDVYQQLLPSGGGTVKITDNTAYFRDSDNYFEITFPIQGGAVSGYTAVNYEEDKGSGDICSVSITYTFSGSFNPSTCQLQGSGTKTLNWGENRPHVCLGYPEPYDDAAENWSMILKNGRFHITGAPSGFPQLGDYNLRDYLR